MDEFLKSLEDLSVDELQNLKGQIDRILKKKFENQLGKRSAPRVEIKIPAHAEIEREREFFNKTHKITILNMSTQGLFFSTTAPVIIDDILEVSFRIPSTGERKIIDCKVLRVSEQTNDQGTVYQAGAVSVTKETVRNYRDTLKNRGK